MEPSVISAEKMSDYVKKLEERIKKLEEKIATTASKSDDKFDEFHKHVLKDYKTYHALRDAVVTLVDYLLCMSLYKVEVVCVHTAYYSIACYRKCECDAVPVLLCEIIVTEVESEVINISCKHINFTYEGTGEQLATKFNRFFYDLSFHNCEYYE